MFRERAFKIFITFPIQFFVQQKKLFDIFILKTNLLG